MSVRNIVGVGAGGYFLTISRPPDAPQALRAFNISQQSFSVSWNTTNGATSYLATATPQTKYAPPISATTIVGTQADWENLENGETYLVVVTAVNAAGQTNSYPITVNTEAPAYAPNPPTGLTAPAPEVHPDGFDLYFTPGVVDLSHGFATNFIGYATDPSSNTVTAQGTAAPLIWSIATSNQLAANTAYSVVMRGVNAIGQSVDSSGISVTTGSASAPTQPVINEFTDITTEGFWCYFTGGNNADYHTGVATAGGSNYTAYSCETSNAAGIAKWGIPPLAADTSYSVVITAFNSTSNTPSLPQTVVTDFPPPTAPTITNVTNLTSLGTQMNIFFDGLQGFQDTSGSFYQATAHQVGTSTSLSNLGPASYVGAPGTKYRLNIGSASNVLPTNPQKGAQYDIIVSAVTANAGTAQSQTYNFLYPA